jgi:hypothetical protein
VVVVEGRERMMMRRGMGKGILRGDARPRHEVHARPRSRRNTNQGVRKGYYRRLCTLWARVRAPTWRRRGERGSRCTGRNGRRACARVRNTLGRCWHRRMPPEGGAGGSIYSKQQQ